MEFHFTPGSGWAAAERKVEKKVTIQCICLCVWFWDGTGDIKGMGSLGLGGAPTSHNVLGQTNSF